MNAKIDSAQSRPPNLAEAVISGAVDCRRCGYSLRGLRADSVCPECGLELWQSILDAADPAASRLPKLRDPVRVGGAMLWLAVCLLAAVLLLVARPLALRIDALWPDATQRLAVWTPPELVVLAGAVALAGLWSVFALAPPRRSAHNGAVGRDLWRIGLGLTAWGLLAPSWWLVRTAMAQTPTTGMDQMPEFWRLLRHLAMAGAAIVCFSGLRGVFQTIGRRSREYRTSLGGRQRVRDIIAAILGIALGDVLRLVSITLGPTWLRTIGTVIVWISTLMLVIGLAYLLLNAWWIRRSLRRPPPKLEEILLPPLPHETGMIGPVPDDEPES